MRSLIFGCINTTFDFFIIRKKYLTSNLNLIDDFSESKREELVKKKKKKKPLLLRECYGWNDHFHLVRFYE